jgi:hypothetical protein
MGGWGRLKFLKKEETTIVQNLSSYSIPSMCGAMLDSIGFTFVWKSVLLDTTSRQAKVKASSAQQV